MNSLKKPHSIMRSMLTMGTITTLASVTTIFLTCIAILISQMKDRIYEQTDMLSEAYASSIENVVSRIYDEIGRAGRDKEIADYFLNKTPEEIEPYLLNPENGRVNDFLFTTVSLIDMNGVSYDGYDLSAREYVQKALAGTTNISSPVFSAKDKVMTYYVAGRMNNGVADGLVFAGFDTSYFNDVIKGYEDSNDYGGIAFVVDSKGTYIACSDMEKVNNTVNAINMAETDKSYTDLSRLVKQMMTGVNGRSTVTLENGVQYYVSYKPIEMNEGWSIAVLIPTSTANAPLVTSSLMALLVSVVVILVTGFAYLRVSRRISNPIIAAVKRLELLENGDLNSTVTVSHSNLETEQLTTSLSNTTSILSQYVREISDSLEQVAQGNLDLKITRNYSGDFAPLRDSLNKIIDSFNAILHDINNSSMRVANSSQQVSQASQTLSDGTSTQASAIEELSASLEEILMKVRDNAENAGVAKANTESESKLIESGSRQMEQMMSAMNDIDEKSTQIASIIKTIDDIAFQTNILALNAAVEAARAGSAGKGFAVVAEEVRNLAAKSAEAAKTTSDLIGRSIVAVENGTKIASDTAKTLSEIVKNSAQTSVLVTQIHEASDEQATAIAEINQGVEQISQTIQSNSATSEETAASAEGLSNEAQGLNDLVGNFNLRN